MRSSGREGWESKMGSPNTRTLPLAIAGGFLALGAGLAVWLRRFRGDGRLDIVVNNFNDQPYFYRNQFPQRNYVGAVVRLHQGKRILTRQVLGACGYLSHSSRTLHFGLDDQPAIDRVEITRPSRQSLDAVAANTLYDITEPAK
jgi:hypothetical protein